MEERNLRKTRVGVVVSDKMDKTIVVADAIQFANEENVKILSLLPIHYNANGYADKYALVYQE